MYGSWLKRKNLKEGDKKGFYIYNYTIMRDIIILHYKYNED